MREISYRHYLSENLQNRIRVSAIKEKEAILGFVVQYEARINDKWVAITRYDTKHGFAHKDIIHPDGSKEKQPLAFSDYKMALTFAITDIKASWKWYRAGYEREMRK